MVQNARNMDMWRTKFEVLRTPLLFDLATDPFERATDGTFYDEWLLRRAFIIVPSQDIVRELIGSFVKYPPRQKPASFSLDDVLDKLTIGDDGN